MVSSSRACRPNRPSRWFHAVLLAILLFTETHASCPETLCDCSSYGTRRTIRCGIRNLSEIPLGLPADTRSLRLEHNMLTKLASGDFSNLAQLESLYLYNNRITLVEEGAFHGLSKLTQLDLTSNNISWVTNRTFEGMPELNKLNLRNNRLADLPQGIFSQVPQLKELVLASNKLNEFPTDLSRDLVNIETLDLSDNPVSLTDSFGQNLATLHLLKLNKITDNAIGQVRIPESAFEGLWSLIELDLQENFLTQIPQSVGSLPNLTKVRLNRNAITMLTDDDFHEPSSTRVLSKLPLLTELTLDGNRISTIPSRAFWHNTQLKFLSVHSSGVTSIDKDAFVGIDQLEHLWLDNNTLTTIVDGVLDNLSPSVELRLANNPLRCDCDLRGFGGWMKNYTGASEALKCAAPERLYGSLVANLEPEKFACTPRPLANAETAVSVTEGSDILLPCSIKADPVVDSYWITNNHTLIYPHQPKPRLSMLSKNNGSLNIIAVGSNDAGSYTCVVKNDAGEWSRSVTLSVSPRWKGPSTVEPTPGARGMVYGIAAGVLIVVIVLIVIAMIIFSRHDVQKKPPPPVSEPSDSELYEEIPAAGHLYDTNIPIPVVTFISPTESVTIELQQSPRPSPPGKIAEAEGGIGSKNGKCVVDLSDCDGQRYKSGPSTENTQYVPMKPPHQQLPSEVDPSYVIPRAKNDKDEVEAGRPESTENTQYVPMKQVPRQEAE